MLIRSIRVLLHLLLAFSLLTTVAALYSLLVPHGVSVPLCTGGGICSIMGALGFERSGLVQGFVEQSPALASGGWGSVVITSLWYQRTTSNWRKAGFDPDVFQILMRTRGGSTRTRLLRSLTTSKNRLELSRELGCDWNVIDRHIGVLLKYGLIEEVTAYGNVRLYQTTRRGNKLVQLIGELQKTEAQSGPPTESQATQVTLRRGQTQPHSDDI